MSDMSDIKDLQMSDMTVGRQKPLKDKKL